jgi:Zn-dependent M28 family amino/carboxypeptidase
VWWSDHWPFWRQGYRAIMITGTAPYRNPFYHSPHDTPDKLDYGRMARVVDGLAAVVRDLAG